MNKNTKLLLMISAGIMAVIFIIVLIVGFTGGDAPQATPDEVSPTETTDSTEPPTAPDRDKQLTLSFIGDCILGSESGKSNYGNFTYVAENESHDFFFSKVKDVLSQDDLTFANVECVLTDRELEKTPKDYSPAFWFTAPAKNADILTHGSVEVAGVVNNHTYDYGEEGYRDTVDSLKAQGLYVGENLSPLYFDIKGMRIGVLYCNLWSEYQTYYIEQALKEMQDECDYRIIFFHGGTEGVHEPDNYKIDACRYLAEQKLCDLIIGSHPHVLQPMEVVNGVPIVYSLGNFCYSANTYPENRTIIFQVLLTEENGAITTATRIVPCYVYTGSENNYQPAIVEDEGVKLEIMGMMNTPVEHQEETSSSTAEPTEVPTEAPTEAPVLPDTDTDGEDVMGDAYETFPQDFYPDYGGDVSETIRVQY